MRLTNPGSKDSQRFLFGQRLSILHNRWRHPLRKGDRVAYMAAGGRVVLSHLCDLFGQEAVGQSSKFRPQAAMNERDLASSKATDENFLRRRDGEQRCIDVLSLWMRPPASLDGLTDDGFNETRCVPPG